MAEDINTLVMKVTSDGIKQGATDLDKLTKAADKAEKAVKKLGTSVITSNSHFATGSASAAAMVAAMEKLTRVITGLTETQTRATRATRGHNESMREAHALARGLSGSFGALWLTYGNFAGMSVGLALGAGLKGVVAVGKDVEHTLEKIRVLGETTTQEVDKLREVIYEMGQGVQGPKDVAEALSVLTMAGLSASDALKGVGASLNLAIAGDVGIEKSASTLVQVGTALGYTADGFDHIADVIAKTAAVSMSSVDSIAGAFKSAAAVGEVYGATLQDIGLGLAAVANLGIQGTAAGTALKNFYKDLASGGEKVVATFRDMKMAQADIKDPAGNFLPLVDVIKKLDEGFNRLKPGERQKAMDKIFGERGVKEGAALVKMLHTVSTETDAFGNKYTSKMDEVSDKINKSFAFSTKAAIAMSQTTTNQMKSVGNTLQTTFAKAFTDIQPQINAVSRELKAAFSSPEFINGIKTIATAVADATRFLVEHAKQITLTAAAYAAWKVTQFTAGIVAMGQAFTVSAVGARAFALSLGPIAVAIMAAGAAWAIYNANKDSQITNGGADKNLEEYNAGLIAAAQKEEKILQMRRDKKTEAQILAEQQMQADKDASDLSLKQATAEVERMRVVFNKRYEIMDFDTKHLIADAVKRKQIRSANPEVNAYLQDRFAVEHAQDNLETQKRITKDATKALMDLRKLTADFQDEAAKAGRVKPTGDDSLGGSTPDKAGMARAYADAMTKAEGQIKAANEAFMDTEDQLNSEFRAGRIGRIELVNQVANAEIAATKKIKDAIETQLDYAQAYHKDSDASRAESEGIANAKRASQADIMRAKFTAEEVRKIEQDAAHYKVKTLEDQGKFAEAAHLKFITENGTMFAQATEEAITYGDVYPVLWKKVEEYTERAKAAVISGKVKEAMASFELAAQKTTNVLKGVQTATEAGGMAGMWQAAVEASTTYKDNLDDLMAKQKALEAVAANGSDADRTKAEEAMTKIEALAEKHKTMWIGVGTSIGNALEQGFGRGGKAMGELVKATISYDKLSDKSATAKVRYYGQAADAVKGFFREGSKGYKTLEGVSKVFHMAEMAQTLGLINLKAIMAVMNQGSGDPYTAFARMAAMAAVVGALGFAVGGGFKDTSGGGQTAEEVQKTQGAGGVFGDIEAKSESIMKSIESLESNSDMLLPLTQGMLSSLKSIEASMTGLTNLVLRAGVVNGDSMGIQTGTTQNGAKIVDSNKFFGGIGPMGAIMGKIAGAILGKTTKEIIDSGIQYGGKVSDLQGGKGYNQYASVDTTKSSFFGLSKKTTNSLQTQGLGDELSSQFGLIFSGLEDTLKLAAPILGKNTDDISKSINDLVIETTTLSLKGLKGQDLQDAINGVISKTMDQIAEAAYPSMGAFRQVGEGYAQTVIRVASGIEQAQVALKEFGITAINYTDIASKTADVATSIIQQSVALKEGASGVGAIMKAMVGSAEDLVTVYRELVSARKSMADMGLGNGLNLQTIEGAGSLEKLTSGLESYYEKFFTLNERIGIETKNLTAQFEAVGTTLPNSREQLRSFVEAAAEAGDQKKVGGLIALADAFDDLNTKMGKGALKDVVALADDAYKALQKAVAKEKKEVDRVFKAQSDANKATHEETMFMLQAELNAKEAFVEAQKEKVNTSISGIEKIINALATAVKATEPLLSQADAYKAALGTAKGAVNLARSGKDIGTISGLEDAIGTLGKPVEDMYSTQLEFNLAQAEANGVLRALENEGNLQLTEAEKLLVSLDLMVATAKGAIEAEKERFRQEQEKLEKQHEEDIAKLDNTLEMAQQQLDALNGINLSVMSLGDALHSFNGAVGSAAMVKAAQVDAGPRSATGNANAIDMLYASLLGRAPDKAGSEFWNGAAFSGTSMTDIAKAIMGSAEYVGKTTAGFSTKLPGFDVGTNFVPEDMNARIHAGERIIPAADNAELMRRLKSGEEESAGAVSNESLKGKIDELIEIIKIGDTANVQKTNELYRIVRDWNSNGMPDVRDTEEV